MTGTASTGAWAEAEAAAYLQRQGLRLLARNFRCRVGELDLVMSDGATLVFIEVRSRSSDRFGTALESVTPAKQRRLLAAARAFLSRHRHGDATCRFDVISVTKRHYSPDFHWVKNAFGQHT
ncbi:MAG: YraN family protein [Pseudomonadales bacterium]